MGFFDKIRKGLTKTKESLIKNIESVVIGYATLTRTSWKTWKWYFFPGISVSARRIS